MNFTFNSCPCLEVVGLIYANLVCFCFSTIKSISHFSKNFITLALGLWGYVLIRKQGDVFLSSWKELDSFPINFFNIHTYTHTHTQKKKTSILTLTYSNRIDIFASSSFVPSSLSSSWSFFSSFFFVRSNFFWSDKIPHFNINIQKRSHSLVAQEKCSPTNRIFLYLR